MTTMNATDKKALAVIDGQLNALARIEVELRIGFGGFGELPFGVGDAWNAVHDAQTSLREERREVEGRALRARVDKANPGFRALQEANID